MKKIAAVGFAAVMMVSLSGCSDASVDISTGKEVLITVGSEKITNDDLFRPLFLNYGYNEVSSLVNNVIFEKEVPVTDEITEAAKKSLTDTKESMGDAFTSQITSNGYKDEDDFYTRAVLPSEQLKALTKKWLNDNAEEQISIYKPVKARIIACTTEENAKNALAAVQGDTSFEDAATEFGKTDTYKGNEIVVNQSSGLPSTVWAKISVVSDKESMISEVIADTTTDANNPLYYVVKVTNTSALEDFKDEAIQSILEKSTSAQTDAMKHYLTEYDFNVYDIDIYNSYKSNKPDYLVQDAD